MEGEIKKRAGKRGILWFLVAKYHSKAGLWKDPAIEYFM
jgi:hypothetical protein